MRATKIQSPIYQPQHKLTKTYLAVLEPRRNDKTPDRRDSDKCAGSAQPLTSWSVWHWPDFLLCTGLPKQLLSKLQLRTVSLKDYWHNKLLLKCINISTYGVTTNGKKTSTELIIYKQEVHWNFSGKLLKTIHQRALTSNHIKQKRYISFNNNSTNYRKLWSSYLLPSIK